jgi:2-keto-3-deoxy-L-fuconate dehydrogenase
MSVAGKVVAITGITSGLGRVLAMTFAEHGAIVTGCGRTADGGQRLEAEAAASARVTASGGRLRFVQADVTDPSQCVSFVAEASAGHGRLDVLINNAGGHVEGGVGPSTGIEVDAWDRTMNLNLRAVFVCCREAIKLMRDQPAGGVILNVASVQAEVAIAQMAAYNAAKAAVVQLSRTLAVEFVEQNVRVNAILLGGVETGASPRVRAWLVDGLRSADRANGHGTGAAAVTGEAQAPAQRSPELLAQRPERVAAAFLTLAGDDAALITGATVSIDRGLVAGAPLSASVLRSARAAAPAAPAPEQLP